MARPRAACAGPGHRPPWQHRRKRYPPQPSARRRNGI